MNRKRLFIFAGMFFFCALTILIYVLYGPKTNDITVSNNSDYNMRQLRVYLSDRERSINGDTNFLENGLETGESVVLADFSILEKGESKTRIYSGLMPFTGDVFLVYEDNEGIYKTVYADSGYLCAQTSGNHVKFLIE